MFTAAILAGGRATRLGGGDKEALVAIEPDGPAPVNANTPEDYARARELGAGTPSPIATAYSQ